MNVQAALQQRAKVEEFQRKHRVVLLTLVFTDLVNSTQLKSDLGEERGVVVIQRYRALVRELISHFKEAEEIETAGDSFFLVFAKPSDAARFSLQLQARLREFKNEIGYAAFNRIGIHIGEVFVEEHEAGGKAKDLYGIQVDICARVMALAEGDQILMTRSAFDNARQVLKGEEVEGITELSWLNHGPYLLKGIEEPLEICEVGEVAAAVLKPPPDSEKVHRYVSPGAEPVLGWRPAIDQAVPGTEWVLIEKLGEGGFGEVWLGRHSTTKERRVFKFCFRADRVRALKREVTLFRLLKERVGEHPNIVRLHEVFFEEPPFYLGMDYVEGRDLKSWCAARGGIETIPQEVRLEIVAQVADALQAAHDAGVIHRDIKPANILIAECGVRSAESDIPNSELRTPNLQAKLTDFGIGQVVSDETLAGLTRQGFTETISGSSSGSLAGTHLYIAPEVLAGRPATIRSDIYSLGVVLYQMLAGDFSKPVTIDWARDVADPFLREDLSSCFAGNPADRFAGAGQLAKNLRSLSERHRLKIEKDAADAARERATFRRGVRRGALVVVPILAFIGLRLWQNAMPVLTIPLPKNPPVNAYYFYRTAGASVQNTNALSSIWLPDLEPSQMSAVESLLRENTNTLRILRIGLTFECRHPPIRSSQSEYFSDVIGFKQLSRLLELEGWLAKSRTNWAPAAASYLDLVRFGAALQPGAPLFQKIVAEAWILQGTRLLAETINHLDQTEAKHMKQALDEIASRNTSFADTLQEEKWLTQASLMELLRKSDWRNELFKQREAAREFFTKDSTPPPTDGSTLNILFADFGQNVLPRMVHWITSQLVSKRGLIGSYNEFVDQWIAIAKKPFQTGFARPEETYVGEEFLYLSNSLFEGFWGKHLFLLTQIDLLRVSLALRVYSLDHGSFPESLTELVPDYLKEIPNDPFSDAAPLHYRREATGYALWSIGPDGKDDQGSFPEDDRRVLLDKLDFKGDVVLMKPLKPQKTSEAPSGFKMDPQLLKRYGLLPTTNGTGTIKMDPQLLKRYGLLPPSDGTNRPARKPDSR